MTAREEFVQAMADAIEDAFPHSGLTRPEIEDIADAALDGVHKVFGLYVPPTVPAG